MLVGFHKDSFTAMRMSTQTISVSAPRISQLRESEQRADRSDPEKFANLTGFKQSAGLVLSGESERAKPPARSLAND